MPFSGDRRARLAALAFVVMVACAGDDDSPTVDAGQSPSTSTSPTITTVVTAPAGGGTTATTPAAVGTVLSVTVRGGSVVEGASRQRATLNQPVTIRVTSDVADEVHVHGYDKTAAVAANRATDLTFVANIPGVFEVEFERTHKLLFTLEVR